MYEVVDRLEYEIINVQLLDRHYDNKKIYTDEYYMREEYQKQMDEFHDILEEYSDFDNVEYEEYQEIISYTLSDVMETLVSDLYIYDLLYYVPKVTITNDEWDLFFVTVANYYIKNNFSDLFFDDMVFLNKMVMAKAMVYEESEITLETYISSLKYIESNILTLSNIMDIVDKLGDAFKIDSKAIFANDDGSYGCIGKCDEVFLLDYSISEYEINTDNIKRFLIDEGYEIINKSKIKNEQESDLPSNVIDFNKMKLKRRKVGK